jgi:hypothetical protein
VVYATGEGTGKVFVAVEGNPDAFIFRDRVWSEVAASVCGECGHVELSVGNPRDLYEHYRRSQE